MLYLSTVTSASNSMTTAFELFTDMEVKCQQSIRHQMLLKFLFGSPIESHQSI